MKYSNIRKREFSPLIKKNTALFALLFAADRLTKLWAVRSLSTESSGAAHLFSLKLHYNYGISFSLLNDTPIAAILLSSLCFMALGFVCVKRADMRRLVGTALLVAGGVCNLTDRLIYGCVIDWLYIFVYVNLADIYIISGALLLSVHVMYFTDR